MRRKKRRMKKGIRNILFFIVFAIIGCVLYLIFESKIQEFFIKNNINIGGFFIEKPKVKIIDENSKTRPIAVSINNNHDAWPHAGLNDAYITYEVIAEGGITRLIALFKDKNPTKIGSVRSTRHYFLDYVLENDAIFVHFGQSPQAKEDLSSLNINNLNCLNDSNVCFRDLKANNIYEHTAFTSMEKIKSKIKSKGYRNTTDIQLLKYSPMKVDLSKDKTLITVNKVSIKYSNYQTTSYEYDKENMNYKLFMDGKKHVDAITKKQYTVKNIITYKVKNDAIGDSKGRQELSNIGSGEGYYITNGQAIKIKWTKKDRASKTIYTNLNGEEIKLNDGNTWIHIQPQDEKLLIE